jgi:hypothetical protein
MARILTRACNNCGNKVGFQDKWCSACKYVITGPALIFEYQDVPDRPDESADFEEQLATLLNATCSENESNTPDYILANYLLDCLNAFNNAVNARDAWYDPDNDGG